MLHLLKELLVSNGYGFEDEIKNIPYSCCTTESVRVFDFDKIKDHFCTTIGVPKLKSVDALYFSVKTDELFFIEMKSYDKTGKLACNDYIDFHFSADKIPNKIVDSFFIILALMGHYSIDKGAYSYLLNPSKLKIRPFLLIDLSYREYMRLVTMSLNKRNIQISKTIDSTIGIVNCREFSSYISSL